MFLENTVNQKEQFGWIEVICGSMFSGKTEELIRRLKRAQFAKQKVEIFKPTVDNRYDDDKVVSHDANEIRSTPVPAAANIRILADDCDVVGIDEAQFFDDEIVSVCNDLGHCKPKQFRHQKTALHLSPPHHSRRLECGYLPQQARVLIGFHWHRAKLLCHHHSGCQQSV